MTTAFALDDLADLAEVLHGRGTALSVDREPGGWRLRLWDAKGLLIEETDLADKHAAVRDMRRRLTT